MHILQADETLPPNGTTYKESPTTIYAQQALEHADINPGERLARVLQARASCT